VTVEGEQVILSLQLARFLIKAANDSKAGKQLAESVRYIGEAAAPGGPEAVASWEAADRPPPLSQVVLLFESRGRNFAHKLASKIEAASSRGLSFEDALNSVAVMAYKAATAHSFSVLVKNNFLALDAYCGQDAKTKAVLEQLLEALCLMEISEHGGDWAGTLSERALDSIEERLLQVLANLRPDLIPLSDAFGFTDSQLDSTLGRADGNVYEAIYSSVSENPLNGSPKMVGWESWSTVLDLEFLKDEEKKQKIAPASKL